MENKVLKPKIRFKGFTDTWEQRKLGKIANIIGGGTPSTLVSKYWNGDINWYSPVEIGDKIFVSSSQKKITQLGYEKSSAKLLPIGTVLFTSRAGIGNTAILAKEGCTNQGFQSIVPNKKEIDSYFIYSMTNQLKEYGEKIGAGSTFAEVSGKQMEEMPINIPKLEEQCKISQLFEKIDNLITLHQSKYDKLVNVKKALLEKMFPKEGKNVPEIRFKGFTDTWEQRKLLDVANYKNGKAHENDIDENGKYIVINSKFVSTDGEVKKYSNKQNEPLNKNDIAFVLSDVPNGKAIAKTFLVDKSSKYTLNQRIAGITPHEDINPKYLAITMNRNKYFLQFDDGVKQTNLSLDDMRKYENYYPTKEEQDKLGHFFEKIDNLITLHQHKLEKLQNIKKSLLNKMFV